MPTRIPKTTGRDQIDTKVAYVAEAGIVFFFQLESLARPDITVLKRALKEANPRLNWEQAQRPNKKNVPERRETIFFPLKTRPEPVLYSDISGCVECLNKEKQKENLKVILNRVADKICERKRQTLPNVSAVQPIMLFNINKPIGNRRLIR